MDTVFDGIGFDAAEKVFAFSLQLIKSFVALITAIRYAGLARGKYLADKGAFTCIAMGQKKLVGDTLVDIKSEMGFCFF